MTTSGHSPVSGFSPRRRTLLFGGLGGAATAALTTLGYTGTAAASQSDKPLKVDFDFDTGNYLEWAQPSDDMAGMSPNADLFGPMDVTVFLWINRLTALAVFDALAPYHETAVGVYSRIRRRPSSESATNRNMNTAAIHATYRVWKEVLPTKMASVRAMMTALGLNPDDESENPTTPVGIANIATKAVWEGLKNDGMNFLGYEGGRRYNPRPWSDYTGYEPVNTAFELVNPSRWQPQLGPHNGRRLGGGHGDMGIFVVQHMVTPHLGQVKAHIFKNPRQFDLAPPTHTDHTRPTDYKRSVDEILEASAALTDKQKMLAEVMDNKVWGIGHSAIVMARKHDRNGELGMHGWIHYLLEHILATFEPTIVAWHHKVRYDSVRPFSAIQHVYGSRKVTAWGGPGKGTVNDMPADQWAGYLNVSDHSEYPSGSTTLAAASAQSARRYFGTDVLDWRFTISAGKSLVEPGVTPGKDLELHIPTWTEFSRICANSRVWGGVHFQKTVDRSLTLGAQFGDLAHEFVQRYVKGDVKN
ncbi:hypothetical protein OH809_42290 [Streptomyces sp. NBC_00873]|uniref:DUF6851 domain-containing protein n=1 Tax=unclassified Streptomyces TaxID=2593676 RepID=UPI0038688651|nr:hypothetical protein OH809_01420 [Streptomyces sp. NBC_00873]WSY96711.1 hypothetical protein OH809_42290 [Streptomyces sp. NBC_00873]WTA41515.1 hypothetical protein OH821_01410 [Streptomyces sp. NBC_00842]WTA48381.1 hypothetical protein OH821_42400 [Streptomyces sp. NBC_00842]